MRIKADLGNAQYGLGTTLSQYRRACCQYAVTPGSNLACPQVAVPVNVTHWYRIGRPVLVNPHIPDMIRAA